MDSCPSSTTIIAAIEAQRDCYQGMIDDELKHACHWHGIEATTKYDLEAYAARLESTLANVRRSVEIVERFEARRIELDGVLRFIRTNDDHKTPEGVE